MDEESQSSVLLPHTSLEGIQRNSFYIERKLLQRGFIRTPVQAVLSHHADVQLPDLLTVPALTVIYHKCWLL